MKPEREKSNCVSDHCDVYFMFSYEIFGIIQMFQAYVT